MADVKRPEDMTPTELFAQDRYGAEPGGPPLYDRFREMSRNAIAEGAGLIKGTDEKFKQWKAENPAAQWAFGPGLDTAAHAISPGLGFASAATNTGSPARPEGPPAQTWGAPPPEQVSSPGGSFSRPASPGVDVNALPDAAPPTPAGVGGGAVNGWLNEHGSDKRVVGAQLDQVADQTGLQEKKAEEGVAHLNTMGVQGQQLEDLGNARALHAQIIKKVADDVDKEQLDHETRWQTAQDEVAAKGVDPGRYFKHKDGLFWISMIIGSAASGMLSAMNGQAGNPFMDTVREAVRTDINAQEKDIEQGWKKSKGLETAYERARSRGADRVTATIRQYDKVLEAMQTDMQGKLLKATIPEMRANIEASLQSLQLERDAMASKMEEYWKTVKEHRASAALTAANAAAERVWRHGMDIRKQAMEEGRAQAQNTKDYAEAGKAQAGDKEQIKDQRAFDEHSAFLTGPGARAVFDPSTPGSLTAKVGVQNAPWQTDARDYTQKVNLYNAEVASIVSHWMKIDSGRVPVGEFNDVLHRFQVADGMPSEQKEKAVAGLKSWVDERAKVAGVAAAGQIPAGAPGGFSGVKSFKPAVR